MSAYAALLELVRTAFTEPGFALFGTLVRGWVCAPGRRTITRVLAVGDPEGRRAHDAYHRLVREGRWSMRPLWRALATHLVGRFCPAGAVSLDLDDTLFHKSGRKVAGAGIFRDPVRSSAQNVAFARGLNVVVVTLRLRAPWGGMPLALPVNARLHRKGDATTILEHARAMLTELASWLPERELAVCADGAFASLADVLPERTALVSRLRRDAALYEAAPPRTGRRGRPRTRGARLPTPVELAQSAPKQQWQRAEVDWRGRRVTRLLWVRDLLWYAVSPKALVRLVIVRDPDGVEPDDFFFSTDRAASGAAIASRYAGRWAIEVCFRDTKQHLGGEDPQCWKGQGPERAACLSLWLTSLVWCWYLAVHPEGKTWIARAWYPRKAAPSFLDALATLRRVLWSQRITVLSRAAPQNTKISTAVLNTLAYAA